MKARVATSTVYMLELVYVVALMLFVIWIGYTVTR
jgi:hypothetical protein